MWYGTAGCIIACTLSLLAVPLLATAQPRGTIPRVGVLDPSFPPGPSCLAGFRQGLRDLGYVEGQTITLVSRYAEGQPDRLPALAAELVQLTPDVLWTHSSPAAHAAKQATTTIPIVVGLASFDATPGLVESLARPGGNLTGLDSMHTEVVGRRLALLKEVVPTITRVAILVDPTNPSHIGGLHNLAAEAQTLGVQLQSIEVNAPETLEGALAAIIEGGAEALMFEGPLFSGNTLQRILAFGPSENEAATSGNVALQTYKTMTSSMRLTCATD